MRYALLRAATAFLPATALILVALGVAIQVSAVQGAAADDGSHAPMYPGDHWAQLTEGNNLVAGKPAMYWPQPDRRWPSASDDDPWRLTDGQLVERLRLWLSSDAVAWRQTGGEVHMVFDMQRRTTISRVAIRTQVGTLSRAQGSSEPESITVLASDDGERFHEVGQIRRERPGLDPADPHVYPALDRRSTDALDVNTFVVDNIDVEARYVGLRIEMHTRHIITDQVAVIEGDQAGASLDAFPVGELIVNRGAAIGYQDRELPLAPNVYMPAAFKVNHLPLVDRAQRVTYHFDVPEYVSIAEEAWRVSEPALTSEAEHGRKIVSFSKPPRIERRMQDLRIFASVDASAPAGAEDVVRIWAEWEDGEQSPVAVPMRVVEPLEPVEISDRLVFTEWLGRAYMTTWPNYLDATHRLGFNTVMGLVRSHWRPNQYSREEIEERAGAVAEFLREARERGYKIAFQDSPIHPMDHPDRRAENWQDAVIVREDGSQPTGRGNICPVHFGSVYEYEMNRIRDVVRLTDNPIDYVFWDCEVNIHERTWLDCVRTREYAEQRDLSYEQFTHEIWKRRNTDFYDAFMDAYRDMGYTNHPRFFQYGNHWTQQRIDRTPASVLHELYPDRLAANPRLYSYGANDLGPLDPHGIDVLNDFAAKPDLISVPYLEMGSTGTYPEERLRDTIAFLLGAGCDGVIYWGNRYSHSPARLLYHREGVHAFRGMTDITLDGDFFHDEHEDHHIFGREQGGDSVVIVWVPFAERTMHRFTDDRFAGGYAFDLFTDEAVSVEGSSVELDFGDGFQVQALYVTQDPATFEQRR